MSKKQREVHPEDKIPIVAHIQAHGQKIYIVINDYGYGVLDVKKMTIDDDTTPEDICLHSLYEGSLRCQVVDDRSLRLLAHRRKE